MLWVRSHLARWCDFLAVICVSSLWRLHCMSCSWNFCSILPSEEQSKLQKRKGITVPLSAAAANFPPVPSRPSGNGVFSHRASRQLSIADRDSRAASSSFCCLFSWRTRGRAFGKCLAVSNTCALLSPLGPCPTGPGACLYCQRSAGAGYFPVDVTGLCSS